jgi:hypothetical protein
MKRTASKGSNSFSRFFRCVFYFRGSRALLLNESPRKDQNCTLFALLYFFLALFQASKIFRFFQIVVGIRSGGRYVEDDEEESTLSSYVQAGSSPIAAYVTASSPSDGPILTPYGYFQNYAAGDYPSSEGNVSPAVQPDQQMQRSELWWYVLTKRRL